MAPLLRAGVGFVSGETKPARVRGLRGFLVKVEVVPLGMAPATAQINRLLAFARPCVVAE